MKDLKIIRFLCSFTFSIIFSFIVAEKAYSENKPVKVQKYYKGINPDNIDLKEYFKEKYRLTQGNEAGHLNKTVINKDAIIEKVLNEPIGEGIVLSGKAISAKEGFAKVTFTLQVEQSGEYYLNALFRAMEGEQFEIEVNDKPAKDKGFRMCKNGWQTEVVKTKTDLSVGKIQLQEGKNTLAVISSEIPDLHSIKIGSTINSVAISMDKINRMVSNAKATVFGPGYKKLLSETNDGLRKAAADDPKYAYKYYSNRSLTYTFWKDFYLSKGTVTFETRNNAGPYASDPIMYLFNRDNPGQGSWVNDDYPGMGLQSKITATITSPGIYKLYIRAFKPRHPGVSDVYRNGKLVIRDAVLAGNIQYVSCDSEYEQNFFTTSLDKYVWSIDPLMMVTRTNKVSAFNDDYYGNGSFNWGYQSRIKTAGLVFYVIYSAYDPYSEGNVDLYAGALSDHWDMHNEASHYMSVLDPLQSFPYLSKDDLIRSSTATDSILYPIGIEEYNCFAWAGGITKKIYNPGTKRWIAPVDLVFDLGLDWVIAVNDILSFKNYFSNNPPRYVGAENYVYSTDYENADIDLWEGIYPYGGYDVYTHTSIKHGNNHAHGYGWESKLGFYAARIFHPRHSLRNQYGGYGDVKAHFRSNGTFVSGEVLGKIGKITLDQSVAMGLTQIEQVDFSASEKVALHDFCNNVPINTKIVFDSLFQRWKDSWNDPSLFIHSSLIWYTSTETYQEFKKYCKSQGKLIWPLLINEFKKERNILRCALQEIIYQRVPQYLDKVKEDNKLKRNLNRGVYILNTSEGNWTKFCKKVIENELLADN